MEKELSVDAVDSVDFVDGSSEMRTARWTGGEPVPRDTPYALGNPLPQLDALAP